MGMSMNARIILAAVTTLLLFGCDSGLSATKSIPPTSTAASGVKFKVAPQSLRVCDPPTEVTVSWDVAVAGINTVKVFVLGERGKEKLFTFSGTKGSEKTGPWTKAGAVFILKEGDETKKLAKFVVGSEKCGVQQ
jgi:hypothetical protein